MTKINYTQERLKGNLRMGKFFVAVGLALIALSFTMGNWKEISFLSIGVGQLATGMMLFAVYIVENKKQYLTLKDSELIKNTLFPKRIQLTEIKSIREFAGDLKLITKNGEFIIDTQIIEPNSLAQLKTELEHYHLI